LSPFRERGNQTKECKTFRKDRSLHVKQKGRETLVASVGSRRKDEIYQQPEIERGKNREIKGQDDKRGTNDEPVTEGLREKKRRNGKPAWDISKGGDR